MGVPGTGPRRSCYSDTGMLAMPLSKVTEILRKYPCKRGGPCRDDLSETRAAIAEVLVREKPGNYAKDTSRRVYKSACTEKGGTGKTVWGAASRGASLEKAIRSTLEDARNDPPKGEREQDERSCVREGRREGRKSAEEEGGGGARADSEESFLPKIATPRRASRHCRLARSTWGRKVRESTEDGESAAR